MFEIGTTVGILGATTFVFLLLFLMALRAYNGLGKVFGIVLNALIPLWRPGLVHVDGAPAEFHLTMFSGATLSVSLNPDGRPWLSVDGGKPQKVIPTDVMWEFWNGLVSFHLVVQSREQQ